MKTVLIIGASSGIGTMTAQIFAKQGDFLILTYNQGKDRIEEIKNNCLQAGAAAVTVYKLDLASDYSIQSFVHRLKNDFTEVDILINNAGVINWSTFREMTFEEITYLISVNLTGIIKLTHACLPILKESIVNVASDVATSIHSGLLVYSVTKSGIVAFTKGLSELMLNLKIYAVSPDKTATDMNQGIGRNVEIPAWIICNTAKGLYNIPSGSNIHVSKVIEFFAEDLSLKKQDLLTKMVENKSIVVNKINEKSIQYTLVDLSKCPPWEIAV